MSITLRALIVEDSKDDAELILREFRRGGYEVNFERVENAESLKAALERAPWDIAIIDYVMPQFSGLAALRIIREHNLNLPCIMVSGSIGEEIGTQMLKAGAHDFIQKDRLSRLVPTIQRELGKSEEKPEKEPIVITPEPLPVRRGMMIRTRLIIIVVVTAILVSLIGIYSAWVHIAEAEIKAIRDAQQIANIIGLSVTRMEETTQTTPLLEKNLELKDYVSDLHELEKRDIVIVDKQKKILADIVSTEIGKIFQHDKENVVGRTISDGLPRSFIEVSPDYPSGIKQVVVPLKTEGGEILGALIIGYTPLYETILSEEKEHFIKMIIIVGFCVGIAILLGYFFSKSIVLPLKQLEQSAVKLGEGDLDTPVKVIRLDEVGKLGRTLDQMRIRLRETISQRENGFAKLRGAEDAIHDANLRLTSHINELNQRSREMNLLSEMGSMLQTCTTSEEAYGSINRYLGQLFSSCPGGLYLINSSLHLAEAVATWGEPEPTEKEFLPEECWAFRSGRLHRVDNPASGLLCPHVGKPLPEAYLCVPMVAGGETLGLLHLRRGKESSVEVRCETDNKQALAVTVAEHLSLALANLRLRETLRQQSIHDPLTGLFNRRYLEETFRRELIRAKRKGLGIAAMMLDIDHFKRVNDLYGHEAGDLVLQTLGKLLQRHVRGGDVACRYGGEEFTLILPEATLEVTIQRAEELRQAAERQALKYGEQPLGVITLSFGVAVYPEHGDTLEAVLQAADTALYRAKESGRNRVEVAK